MERSTVEVPGRELEDAGFYHRNKKILIIQNRKLETINDVTTEKVAQKENF